MSVHATPTLPPLSPANPSTRATPVRQSTRGTPAHQSAHQSAPRTPIKPERKNRAQVLFYITLGFFIIFLTGSIAAICFKQYCTESSDSICTPCPKFAVCTESAFECNDGFLKWGGRCINTTKTLTEFKALSKSGKKAIAQNEELSSEEKEALIGGRFFRRFVYEEKMIFTITIVLGAVSLYLLALMK